MQIYLPIAELPVNIFLVLGVGLAVGFISGMFGIGGGFLMTPLLIFIGISPAVAVASMSSHIAASSFTGAITYWRKRALDLALALTLLSGGIVGTATGVWVFTILRALDQLDLMIGLSYVTLLTIIGGIMIYESVRARLWAVGAAGRTVRDTQRRGRIMRRIGQACELTDAALFCELAREPEMATAHIRSYDKLTEINYAMS